MLFNVSHAVIFPWLGLAAFWVITAISAKRSVRRQSSAARLYHLLFMTAVFSLLFRQDLRIGLLRLRIVPASPQAAYIGLALTSLGAAFAIWARSTLGGNWSASVTVKENHLFVHYGPYRLVRHPILCWGSAYYARNRSRVRRSGLFRRGSPRIRGLVVESENRGRVHDSTVWRRLSSL